MFKFVVVLAVATLTLGALKTKHGRSRLELDGRIVGGQVVEIEDYPYQVSLLFPSGHHFCGGSIISSKYVVTAAHCTYGSDPSKILIRAGSSIVNKGGVVVKVAKIHEHPKFDFSYEFDYDVSVLELENELTYGSNVAKVNLPTHNQNFPAGTNGVVSGWGALHENGFSRRHLRAVTLQIVEQRQCEEAHGNDPPITERMFCAGWPEGGRDVCYGDFGGPFVVNGSLVGIISRGVGCARPEYPHIYTSVPSIRDYIKAVSGV